MVIDLILDKKDYEKFLQDNEITAKEYEEYYNDLNEEEQAFSITPYTPHDFYMNVLDYYQNFNDDLHENILKALDYGTNGTIQKALCDYVTKNGSQTLKKHYASWLAYMLQKKSFM